MSWIRNRRQALIAANTALLIFAAMVAPLPLAASAPQTRTLAINARAFAYEPATIRVQHGDTVTIHLESLDVVHGLFIDGYDVDIQAEPGKSAQVTFVADKEGKFNFRCSVSCGTLHPFMIGEIKVGPNARFVRAIVATLIATLGAITFFWRKTI